MTRLGSRIRPLTTAALALVLALSAGACDKGNTNNPGGNGGGGEAGGKVVAGGEAYSYSADGFTVTATMRVKMELNTSEGQGSAEINAVSLIEAKPAAGKLEVHGKVLNLENYTGSGNLDPEFIKKQSEEQGGKAMDIVANITNSETWKIMDLKGEEDEEASKALAQNQRAEGEEGPMDMGLFGLPDLPSIDLEVGKKVALPTRDSEESMPFGGTIPMQIDETWVLRGVEGDIAEFDVTIESSGATEMSGGQGSAMISMLEESAFTIKFDMKARVPVSLTGYSQSETNVDAGGQSFSMAINNEIEATYVVGAAAPAADAPAADAPAADAPAADAG